MKIQKRTLILPALALLGGIALTVFIADSLQRSIIVRDRERFHNLSAKIPQDIISRLEKSLMGVRSVAAFVKSQDDKITLDEFRKFANARDVTIEFGASIGLGFIKPIHRNEAAQLEANLKKEYGPSFQIKSDLSKDELYVITHVEPSAMNRRAQGFDVAQEANRKMAADIARRSGRPALTNRITLVQDENKEPGFLLYYPVYKGQSRPYSDFERERLFLGWAYSPIVISRVVTSLTDSIYSDLDIHIFQGRKKVESAILYENYEHSERDQTTNGNAIKSEEEQEYFPEWESDDFAKDYLVKFGEQEWVINVRVRDSFFTIYSRHIGEIVTVLGVILNLLAAFAVWQSLNMQASAQSLASRMTRSYLEKNKELEKALHDLDEARASSINSARLSALGEMAGSMAHEINNPLTVISAKAEWVLRSLQNPTEPQKLALSKIVETTHRIAKIIKALRTVAREGEQDPVVETPVQVLIDESLELCQSRMKNKEIDLRIVNQSQESLESLVVPMRIIQMMQVLINLLNNSVDAVESLSDKWIEVQIQTTPDLFILSVTDSGTGIPAEVAEKIMNPFFTTKEVGKGTGLGLSISRSIVESHGGRFWLDKSHPHTRFVIELPRAISDSQKVAS